jgi:hypothetical protein
MSYVHQALVLYYASRQEGTIIEKAWHYRA